VLSLYIVFIGGFSLARHWSFQTAMLDLGLNHQAVWSTLHGRPFKQTGGSSLAYHFEPLIFLLAPFLLVWDKAETLLILQTLLLASGAIPIFLIARAKLQSDLAALAFSLVYLLSPALQAANLADFHTAPLAVPLFLFACYFAFRRHLIPFLSFAILTMMAREDMFYLAFLLGLYAFLRLSRKAGAFLMALSLLYALCAFTFIIPHYARATFGENYLYTARYRDLRGVKEAFNLLLSRGPGYSAFLLAHTGFLSLLAPEVLLLSTPFFLLNVLSNYPPTYTGEQHYSAIFLPFLVLSAVFGVARVRRELRPIMLSLMVLSAFSLHFLRGFSPLAWNVPFPRVTHHHRLLSQFASLVPAKAPLATTTGLYPHFTSRAELYPLPSTGTAEYVLLDVISTTDMHPADFHRKFLELLSEGFGIVKASHGYILLRKGQGSRELPDEFFEFAKVKDPRPSYPFEVCFEGKLLLKGLDLIPYREGKLLFVRTYWEPLGPLPEGLQIHVYLMDRRGVPFAGTPFHPLPTLLWYPPFLWKPKETVMVDTIPWDLGRYFVVAVEVSSGEKWRVSNFKADTPLVLLYGDTMVQVAAFKRSSSFLCRLAPPERCPFELSGEGGFTPQNPVNVNFGGIIALKGYDLRPGRPKHLTLYWQALNPIPEDYSVFVHVLNEEGQKIAQSDGPPFWLTEMGTSSWVPGRTYRDERFLEVPEGKYKLEVGIYRWQDLSRLPAGERDSFLIEP